MCSDSAATTDDSVEAGALAREIEITPEAMELANAFYEALKVVGPSDNYVVEQLARERVVTGRPDNSRDYYGTLIDGEFDLVKIAKHVLTFINARIPLNDEN